MTKDVLVKISGLQFAEDQDNGPVEIITTGNYYKKNGKHYILYDEVQEGFDGVTKSVIKVNDDFLDVTKKGVTNVHMMFEKTRKICLTTTHHSEIFWWESMQRMSK